MDYPLLHLSTIDDDRHPDTTAWVAWVREDLGSARGDVCFGGRVKTQDEPMVTAALVIESFFSQIQTRIGLFVTDPLF